MKTTIYSILAAAACGVAFGQTAYTTPVGYTTQSLGQGFNASGLSLQTPSLAAGNFETVVGTALTDDQLVFTPTAGKTYILEIVSAVNPAAVGVIQEIASTSIVGTTITTPTDISALVAAGTGYKLRVAPTLEQIFTTVPLASGGTLFAATNSDAADNIWLANGAGGYDIYFLRSGASGGFRNVLTPLVNTPNVPVIYADGFLVEKKQATTASLTVSGEVKTVGTNSVMVQGFNLFGPVAPVGLNLFNAGLEDDVFAATNADAADNIWIQQANLSYKQYFRRSGASGGWRDVITPLVNLTQAEAEAITISAGFFIERKPSGTANLDLKVPASYSGL